MESWLCCSPCRCLTVIRSWRDSSAYGVYLPAPRRQTAPLGVQRKLLHAQVWCRASRRSAYAGIRPYVNDRRQPDATPSSAPGGGEVAAGTLLGAISLISTNTIGAGILALPATSSAAGFGPSCTALCIVWLLLTMDAFLIAEVNIAVREEKAAALGSKGQPDGIVTLRQMAAATLGSAGASAVSVIYLFIAYSLLIAYDSKIGSIVGSWNSSIPAVASASIFTAAMLYIISAGQGAIVRVSRSSMVGMLAMYAVIMAAGSQQADWESLLAGDWSQTPATVPILLLTLVYHDLIPVVVALLKGDRALVQRALLLGSLLPLAMFLGWNLVALAQPHLELGGPLAGRWDPVQQLMESGGLAVGTAVSCFSVLAITTSFLGAALGLTATLATEVRAASVALQGLLGSSSPAQKAPEEADPEDLLGRLGPGVKAALLFVALGPPLLICAKNPDSFFPMLEAAGGYGMTALYGVLPPIMAWQWRTSRQVKVDPGAPYASSMYARLVPGGNLVLAFLVCCATTVEVGHLVLDSDVAPAALTHAGQKATEALAQLWLAPMAALGLTSLQG